MKRRDFISLAGTFTGGALLLPNFLYALGKQPKVISGEESLVFIQLNGGNDGLNTFIPYTDPLYYTARPKIAIAREEVIGKNNGMAFHPALEGFTAIQQNGDLCVLQNVGYPNPNRSHFRSQEIWQTGSAADQYISEGWLGRYLDLQCADHQPTAGINLDAIDNLALKGVEPNSLTVKNPSRFRPKVQGGSAITTSGNPQLDFVRKIAHSATAGAVDIQNALSKSRETTNYPKSGLGKNLSWIGKLIKGNLNSKVYYTSLNGFDTHDSQLYKHNRLLTELNDAVFAFYKDLKQSGLINQTTIVIFSEFGRRVKDNGKGTDHGTAAPMFIIGGNNQGRVIGKNPNLELLDNGDLQYKIDFRSVYASLLAEKMGFDATNIGINAQAISGIF